MEAKQTHEEVIEKEGKQRKLVLKSLKRLITECEKLQLEYKKYQKPPEVY
jgi:hypothetical protein